MGGGCGDPGGGADPPPLRISFPCAITMASGVQLKEGERRVALYAYRFREGGGGGGMGRKLACAVRGGARDG